MNYCFTVLRIDLKYFFCNRQACVTLHLYDCLAFRSNNYIYRCVHNFIPIELVIETPQAKHFVTVMDIFDAIPCGVGFDDFTDIAMAAMRQAVEDMVAPVVPGLHLAGQQFSHDARRPGRIWHQCRLCRR